MVGWWWWLDALGVPVVVWLGLAWRTMARFDAFRVRRAAQRALSGEPREALLSRRDAYQEMFRSLIVDGIEAGDLSAEDPAVATYAILLQCTGVALWYQPGGPLELERIADLHVELVMGSLRADEELISEAVGMTAERMG